MVDSDFKPGHAPGFSRLWVDLSVGPAAVDASTACRKSGGSDVRYAPESGAKADIARGRRRASCGHRSHVRATSLSSGCHPGSY